MTIGYRLQGNPASPRVLFLHGFWGDRYSFDGVIEQLGDRVYALSLDLPGHGQTPILGNCAMETVAGQVMDLLDRLAFWPCTIVGYSMGGRLALYLTVRLADQSRLTGLILESASPGLADPIAQADRRRADEIWAKRLESEPIEGVLDDWYRQPIFSSLVQHPAFPRMRSQRLSQRGHTLAKVLRDMGLGQQPNLWPLIPRLTHPTRLIVGDRDAKFCHLNHRIQAQNPGKITLQILRECGHNCHVENPTLYATIVLSFLQENQQAAD
jgi:2-succinyl-6-hydroxy-2,4-cyclohexadiene-1-carboxylate synthase